MRLKRTLLPALMTVGLLALAVASTVHAAPGDPFGLNTAAGDTIPKTTDIAALIGKILQTLLSLVGTLFLLLMLYAGFTYMTARGDAKKIEEAKKMITGAILGIVIIASAYAITSFVLTAVSGTPSATTTTDTSTATFTCRLDTDCPANEGTCKNIDATGEGECLQ